MSMISQIELAQELSSDTLASLEHGIASFMAGRIADSHNALQLAVSRCTELVGQLGALENTVRSLDEHKPAGPYLENEFTKLRRGFEIAGIRPLELDQLAMIAAVVTQDANRGQMERLFRGYLRVKSLERYLIGEGNPWLIRKGFSKEIVYLHDRLTRQLLPHLEQETLAKIPALLEWRYRNFRTTRVPLLNVELILLAGDNSRKLNQQDLIEHLGMCNNTLTYALTQLKRLNVIERVSTGSRQRDAVLTRNGRRIYDALKYCLNG